MISATLLRLCPWALAASFPRWLFFSGVSSGLKPQLLSVKKRTIQRRFERILSMRLYHYCVYGLILFVAFGAMPSAELAESQKPLSDLARLFMGDFGANFIAIIAVCSIIGVMNNTILLTGRTSYAIARDGLFPQVFSKTNKYGVPSGNIILGSAWRISCCLPLFLKHCGRRLTLCCFFSTLFCLKFLMSSRWFPWLFFTTANRRCSP